MLDLLVAAQNGDHDAQGQVAIYCFKKYQYRLNQVYSKDPAISKDDIESTFFEAIYKAVPGADGRGDDFYHIGQRGVWAVLSEIRAIRGLMKRRTLLPQDEEANPILQLRDLEAEFEVDRVVNVLDAVDRVHILARADLRSRERQALEALVGGMAGDPDEPGFNQRLAGAIGVSPQRASQLMASLREKLT